MHNVVSTKCPIRPKFSYVKLPQGEVANKKPSCR